MRRCSLAAVALALVAPVVLVAEPAAAATTQTSSCTDGGQHRWKAKAVWGAVYSSRGTERVSLRSVKFTTKDRGVKYVDYTITVLDGDGGTVQQKQRADRKFAFKKGKRYLSVNPKNPPSSPGLAKVVLRVGEGRDGGGGCSVSFVQPGEVPSPPSPPVPVGSWPSSPPVKVCGNAALLEGPRSAPAGAVVVPKGDNSGVDFEVPGRTYWFAPGMHTLGSGEFDQIGPGDGSTFVGAPGAVLDGRKKNRYAFGGDARKVTITYLTVQNFVAPSDEGTVNHDSGEGWTVSHSTIRDNGGAGLFLGSHNTASYNCLADNSQYGFQGYSPDGPTGLVLDHNEITGNNTGDWERRQPGCGCTGGGKFWDANTVRVTNNYVHHNKSVGLWADTNDYNFLFEGNWISDNDGQAIFYETSYNAAIRNNVIKHNQVVDGRSRIAAGDDFPDAAVYLSESGGDSRVPYGLVGSPTIDISGNLVVDNYNGVTLWENADRFCGSPNNTSTGYCTLVRPSVATLSTCTAGKIAKEPYRSDCRWKTQNVKVHHNTFSMNRANFFGCPAQLCGRNAVFSNYGTSPDWSPYQGDVVTKAITLAQGNTFSSNTYRGEWHFSPLDSYRVLTPAQWQAAPYHQDSGSTFTP